MASRVKRRLAIWLLWAARKLTETPEPIKEPIDPPECLHLKSLKAGTMGRPMKRICLNCKEEFDGGPQDGD